MFLGSEVFLRLRVAVIPAAIGAGFVDLGLPADRRTEPSLATTVLTSFLFPFDGITPTRRVGKPSAI